VFVFDMNGAAGSSKSQASKAGQAGSVKVPRDGGIYEKYW